MKGIPYILMVGMDISPATVEISEREPQKSKNVNYHVTYCAGEL